MSESHPEILEALRLLHERVARIETLHQGALQLPTNWNPFSGASQKELQRLSDAEASIDQLKRAITLHDALDQNLLGLINELQTRIGLRPTPPLPYAPQLPPSAWPAPQQPQPSAPAYVQPSAPAYVPPSAPPGYPVPYDPSIPSATVVAPAAARLHALNAKYRRFIQEADLLSKTQLGTTQLGTTQLGTTR